ncbi:MAG TPA: DUF4142 domain-containing protein [Gemmatimonadaceae bacterium]|nr:DUF4142 domain-containing protein [Gemmatimonadaceae bacterium]
MTNHTHVTRAFGAMMMAGTLVLGACKSNERAARADSAAVASNADTAAAMMRHDTLGARTDTAGGAVTGGAEWSDAQIFGMISAANTGEIAAGKLAETRATNAQVKAFARQMVTDHTAMQKQGTSLAKKLNVTPAMPPDSSLITDTNDDIKDLQKKARGSDWDNEYIDKQVDAHKKTLDLLDRADRSAQHPELKQLIQQARPKVQAHLDRANQLKNSKAT